MTSWQTIGKPHDPILGQPTNFETLETQFTNMRSSIGAANGQLQGIRFGDGKFEGEAASAFKQQLADIDNYLDDLGDVCHQIENVLDSHATQLRRLRQEADNALARAQTRWNQKQAAEADRDAAFRRVNSLQYQIDSVTDTDGGGQRDYLQREMDAAQRWEDRSRQDVRTADARLDDVRFEWDELRRREADLCRNSADGLRRINLESLANPALIQQVWNAGADYVAWRLELLTTLGDWLSEQMDGWLGDVLTAFYEALGTVSMLLTVISLVMALTGVGAPFAAVLFAVAGAIAVARLATGVALLAAGRNTLENVAWDLVGAALFGASASLKHSAKVGGYAAKTLKISQLESRVKIIRILEVPGKAKDLVEFRDPVLPSPTAVRGFFARPVGTPWGISHREGSRPCLVPTAWSR